MVVGFGQLALAIDYAPFYTILFNSSNTKYIN